MIQSLRLLAPALLLLLSLAQPTVALRRQGQSAGKEIVSRDVDPDGQLPLAKKKVWAYMKEYEANLSHTRGCATSKDMISRKAALVVPALKLAFCYVPKVACTQFKDLINSLNHIDRLDVAGYGKGYLESTAAHLGVNETGITRENGWKFATFTRDPALRFLSAFGSTCVAKTSYGEFENFQECCGPHVYSNALPLEDIVEMFEMRAEYDRQHGFIAEEDHWVPQVRVLQQCGWDNFNPAILDFHGDLSARDVNAQVKKMLKMVGGTEDWMMQRVDQLFPEGDIAGHRSPIRQLRSTMESTFYRNKAILESVLTIYEDDYKQIPGVGASFSDKQQDTVEKP